MKRFFFIRINNKYIKLNFDEIIYVEASRNYVKLFTKNRHYLALISLKKTEDFFPDSEFIRIHKSYIISMKHLTEFDNNYVSLGDIKLPIGEQFRHRILDQVVVLKEDTCEHHMENNIVYQTSVI